MARLYLGYFEAWGAEGPMILFAGGKGGVHKLELIFHDLAKGELEEVNFNNLCDVRTFHDIQLKALLSSEDTGLLRKGETPCFDWGLLGHTWETFAELLSGLNNGDSGCQYLHAHAEDDTKVMVALNEYGEDWAGWLS